jgi:hypothetical protein
MSGTEPLDGGGCLGDVAKPVPMLALVLMLFGCTSSGAPPVAAGSGGCSYDVRRDVLPAWARTGFSDPSPSGVPYVMGTRGDILGVLFGYPLKAPPVNAGPTNKILWVSRVPVTTGDTLRISAQRDGETVSREVAGGPGPSTVDLPVPGCWHLTLTWSGHTDTMDLRYES